MGETRMKKLLRESVPDVIGGLAVASLLGAIGLLGNVVGLRDLEADAFLRYAVTVCLFLVLFAATLFVVFSRRRSAIDPSAKHYRFARRHRVLAAVAASISMGLAAWWFLWPVGLPPITVAIDNATDADQTVSRFAAFSIVLDTPLEADRSLATGRAFLASSVSGQEATQFKVPARAQLHVVARIQKQSRYRRLIGAEDTFIALVLFDDHDRVIGFSSNRILFAKRVLSTIPLRITIR